MKFKEVMSSDGKNLIAAIRNLQDKSVKVGWITGSKYPGTDTPVAMAAAQNEFGNPNKHIPPRPFMRPTVMERQKYWQKEVENGSKKVLKNQLTMTQVLELLGSNAVGDIKRTISKIYYPALAERTVLARIERNKRLSSKKGRLSEKNLGNVTKPLIDTKTMFNTITHEVFD